MTEIFLVKESDDKKKKYDIFLPDGNKISIGAKGYEDYTIHKDKKRRDLYDARHKKRENWGKRGINTRGFWAKWLLWNKPTIDDSIKDIIKRFNVIVATI